jgi:hypothetical protein
MSELIKQFIKGKTQFLKTRGTQEQMTGAIMFQSLMMRTGEEYNKENLMYKTKQQR